MDLTQAVDHADPYLWSTVLLSHVLIGAILTATLAAVLARLTDMLAWVSAVEIVAIGYALAWEGAVQRFGAGLADAAVDSGAVTAGGLMAWGLWAHRWRLVRLPGALVAVVLAWGIWRRSKGADDDRA